MSRTTHLRDFYRRDPPRFPARVSNIEAPTYSRTVAPRTPTCGRTSGRRISDMRTRAWASVSIGFELSRGAQSVHTFAFDLHQLARGRCTLRSRKIRQRRRSRNELRRSYRKTGVLEGTTKDACGANEATQEHDSVGIGSSAGARHHLFCPCRARARRPEHPRPVRGRVPGLVPGQHGSVARVLRSRELV